MSTEKRDEQGERGKGLDAKDRRLGRKTFYYWLALALPALGLGFTLILFFDRDFFLQRLLGGTLVEKWLLDFYGLMVELGWLEQRPEGADRWMVATAVTFLIFAVAVLFSFVMGSWIAEKFKDSELSRRAMQTTRGDRMAGTFMILAGLLIFLAFWILPVRLGVFLKSLPYLANLLPFLSCASFASLGLGLATLIRMDLDIGEPRPVPADPAPEPPPPRETHITGKELLEILRRSPIYRRQVFCDFTLGGNHFAGSEGTALDRLLARYPRVRNVLPATGVGTLSHDQAQALDAILSSAERSEERKDFTFFGWPGAGRSTLANLVTLAAVLHREGAMYCVTAESQSRSVDVAGDVKITARHPITQLNRWIRDAELEGVVRLQQSYVDPDDPGLRLAERPDMIFTDVSMLSRSVLSKVRGDARELISRLRYVVIDHPNRLAREDLVRLRIAISRLRMSAELFGRSVTFIVILPRLNNHQQLAKYLLNNDNVGFHEFTPWTEPCHVVGWLPPLEIHDAEENEAPTMVRASFTEEVINLLSELGYQSNKMIESQGKPLRMAIIDAIPLLGPEAREHIRTRVSLMLGQEADADYIVRTSWTYLATSDIAIDRQQDFDVVICLGIGDYPTNMVSSLRAALAPEGALFLVGDSSPSDIESLRTIAADGWDPQQAIIDVEYPSILLPDHSEAVIAHELAGLFEDFQDRPLPRGRLRDVFPGEHTGGLLERWEERRHVRPVNVFKTVREGTSPEVQPYLVCSDRSFSATQYEVPWGCCSRRVYRVYDESARRYSAVGRYLKAYVDADRVFIDFFPYAVLRFPPNTVLVRDRREHGLTEEDKRTLERRFVNLGDIVVVQQDYDEGIGIDRRTPRLEVELVGERPYASLSPWDVEESELAELDADPIAPLLRPTAAEDDEEVRLEARQRLVDSLHRPSMGAATRRAAVHLVGGSWICQIRERFRDLAKTTERLVEDAELIQKVNLQRAQRFAREYESVATSLFFQVDAEAGEVSEELRANLASYAAHHALARTLERYLRRQYVNFHDELRIAVVPHEESSSGAAVSGYRILIYRLYGDELGRDLTISSLLTNPPALDDLFNWIHHRLESCDCTDGCSKCCSNLGTVPEGQLPLYNFTPEDAVTRKGAYVLACALMGRSVRWDDYYEGVRSHDQARKPKGEPWEIQELLHEIVGSAADGAVQGVWAHLFGPATGGASMVLLPAFLATVRWMARKGLESASAGPESPKRLGFYRPGANEIRISPDHPSMLSTKETLIHELVHNWQFMSSLSPELEPAQQFDLERHYQSPESRRFFEGKLVIEGNAVWADHQYRFFRGLDPAYHLADDAAWSEYKAGYFLMEGIEKAFGQHGLFLWLSRDPQAAEGSQRSRNPNLRWPFTLTEALDSLHLMRFVRGQKFTDFDVVPEGEEAAAEPDEEPAPTPDETPAPSDETPPPTDEATAPAGETTPPADEATPPADESESAEKPPAE